MVKESYDHYICDYCGNEVIDKSKESTSKWIAISRAGTSFHDNEKLMIGYMKSGWNTFGFKSKFISRNLSFCCKECLLKFMLKHLGEPEDIPDEISKPTIEPRKPVSRFDGIETIHNVENMDKITKTIEEHND